MRWHSRIGTDHAAPRLGEHSGISIWLSIGLRASLITAARKLFRVLPVVLTDTEYIAPRTGHRREQVDLTETQSGAFRGERRTQRVEPLDQVDHVHGIEWVDAVRFRDDESHSLPTIMLKGGELHSFLHVCPPECGGRSRRPNGCRSVPLRRPAACG